MWRNLIRRNTVILLLTVLSIDGVAAADRAVKVVPISRVSDSDSARVVSYSFSVENITRAVVQDAELWVYAPPVQTATQQLVSLNASHPYQFYEDALGNQRMRFVIPQLGPYGTAIVRVQAQLVFTDEGQKAPVKKTQQYTREEKFIEVKAEEIRTLAIQLRSDTPVKTMRKIHDWTADNISFAGFSPEDKGALYALSVRQGDCTEAAYLAAALGRANNIPVRVMGGFVYSEGAVLRPEDYHNWTEFYVNGRWSVLDPQKKNFMRNGSDYIALRILSTEPDPLGIPSFHRFYTPSESVRVVMN